ncbi:MAG: 23S rRNA (guanosine(2251)-2'-O)-methyltransferase RlmB [Pseudomonadota bacterium]|nr:23S rRNA (guanosine(2251)-2'-O)-methyltransferase RlmB [Pseudomonadota bacterium]
MAGGRSRNRKKTLSRQKSADIWIYGHHAVLAAINNPNRETKRVLQATSSQFDGTLYNSIANVKIEVVSSNQLESILPSGAVHQGIATLVKELPSVTLDEICTQARTKRRGVVVILDQVTDPRNLGSIIRSAAVFGALAVIVQERNSPKINGVIAKAASGGVEKVSVVRVTNITRAIEKLKLNGFWCVGLESQGANEIDYFMPQNLTAIALGGEGAGLRRLVKENCDELIKIKGNGPISSLNVSNAAAVALFALTKKITK